MPFASATEYAETKHFKHFPKNLAKKLESVKRFICMEKNRNFFCQSNLANIKKKNRRLK